MEEFHFDLAQFIAINARFVAAVAGDRDRWLLVYADERTGFHPMIQKLQDSRAVLLGAVAIFAVGLTTSGYALGDGLRRSKMAEHRTVTVRGVSERNVTADLATWSVNFSHQGTDLGAGPAIRRPAGARGPRLLPARRLPAARKITDSDVSLSREQPRDKDGQPVGPQKLTVSRSIQLRTNDVMRARARLCAPGRAAARRRRAVRNQHHLHLHQAQRA